jgi:hypothetical protein
MTEIVVIYLVASVGLVLVKIVNFANSKAKRKQNKGVKKVLTLPAPLTHPIGLIVIT